MATTAEPVTETDLDRLTEGHVFRDPEAVDVVPRVFGAGTPVMLDVDRDGDASDRAQLFALIRTTRGVDAALAS